MITDPDSLSPASHGQRSMWAFALRYRTANLNEMIIPWHVRGPLAAGAMQGALGDLVARHPTLRSRLSYQHGQLHQRIMPPTPVTLGVVDVEAATPAARLEAAVRALSDPDRPALDILNGPTFLAQLYRLDADEHVLCLYVHHGMCDGWSIGIMLRELVALYQARLEGRVADLPALTEQYVDVARWEQQAYDSGQLDDEIRYWRAELDGLPPPVALPAIAQRKGNRDWRAGTTHVMEPAAFLQGLRETAGKLRASPFALLLAALAVLLRHRTGSEDLLVGVPTLNRWSASAMQIVGYMTSMLPVRVRPAGALGFDALCAQAHTTIRKMLAYGRVPLEVLLRETALAPSGNTVFPIWAQFLEDSAGTSYQAAGLHFTPLATDRSSLLAELDVDMVGAASGWRCEFAYRSALFAPDAMHSMMLDYVGTLRRVMEQPRTTVQELTERLS
ncbi:MAG: hypothetical protein JNJ89_14775 [Rubrivivax sp.]|nr:hypothetical protein [Rubrivivax sp.]